MGIGLCYKDAREVFDRRVVFFQETAKNCFAEIKFLSVGCYILVCMRRSGCYSQNSCCDDNA